MYSVRIDYRILLLKDLGLVCCFKPREAGLFKGGGITEDGFFSDHIVHLKCRKLKYFTKAVLKILVLPYSTYILTSSASTK